MELGEKIKELRLKRNWTQEDLAESLSVTCQTVSKWENMITMPDISLLPKLSFLFGVTIDDLFSLSIEQKLNRIESKLDMVDELSIHEFDDIKDFLLLEKENDNFKYQSTSLLAYLYTHRLMSDSKRIRKYAKEAIMMDPDKKDAQWMLGKTGEYSCWDWNMSNHTEAINFYKEVVNKNKDVAHPYWYLIDNLIADHRCDEAEYYVSILEKLKPESHVVIMAYKAGIKLARFDEAGADAIIKEMEEKYRGEKFCAFEIAQYYAKNADYKKAIAYYEESFLQQKDYRYPRYIDELLAIRDIYNILGDKNKEIDAYNRVIDCLKNEWNSKEEDSQLKDMIAKRDELVNK